MDATLEYLQRAIEHAPRDPGKLAANLRGWWTPDGYYVCANCAGRIMARGCNLPRDSEPVWTDRPEPFGVCCCCEVSGPQAFAQYLLAPTTAAAAPAAESGAANV